MITSRNYVNIFLGVCILTGIQGCNKKTPSQPLPRTYHWETSRQEWASVDYKETWRVYTEPTECRVYVNDNYKGVSPLTCTGGGVKAVLYRIEEYPVPSRPGGPDTHISYEWVTVPNSGCWEINAFKEGFAKGTYMVHLGDKKFLETVNQYQDLRHIPEQIAIERNILVELKPVVAPRP